MFNWWVETIQIEVLVSTETFRCRKFRCKKNSANDFKSLFFWFWFFGSMGISHVLFSLVTKFGFDSNDFLTLEKECSMDFVLRISLPDWLTNQPNKIKRRTHYNIILLSVLRASVSLSVCDCECMCKTQRKFFSHSLSLCDVLVCLVSVTAFFHFFIAFQHRYLVLFYSRSTQEEKKTHRHSRHSLTISCLIACHWRENEKTRYISGYRNVGITWQRELNGALCVTVCECVANMRER